MAIHNRQNLHALAAFRKADRIAPALRGGKGGIDEALAFVDRAFIPQRIGQLGEDLVQHFPLTPLLEPPMDGFVIRIALREQVPLRPRVQHPEPGVQDRSGGHRFASGAAIRNVFFGEMLPNSVPLIVAQTEHDRSYKHGFPCRQLF